MRATGVTEGCGESLESGNHLLKGRCLKTQVEAEICSLTFKWAENMTFPTGFNSNCSETKQQNYPTDLSSVCLTSNFHLLFISGSTFSSFFTTKKFLRALHWELKGGARMKNQVFWS